MFDIKEPLSEDCKRLQIDLESSVSQIDGDNEYEYQATHYIGDPAMTLMTIGSSTSQSCSEHLIDGSSTVLTDSKSLVSVESVAITQSDGTEATQLVLTIP